MSCSTPSSASSLLAKSTPQSSTTTARSSSRPGRRPCTVRPSRRPRTSTLPRASTTTLGRQPTTSCWRGCRSSPRSPRCRSSRRCARRSSSATSSVFPPWAMSLRSSADSLTLSRAAGLVRALGLARLCGLPHHRPVGAHGRVPRRTDQRARGQARRAPRRHERGRLCPGEGEPRAQEAREAQEPRPGVRSSLSRNVVQERGQG